jgi:hypothetical protein
MSHKQTLESIPKFGRNFGLFSGPSTRHSVLPHRQVSHRAQTPPIAERLVRLCLRAMGGMALTVCIIFWLTLYWQ